MPEIQAEIVSNVIPVWGLMEQESQIIWAFAQELIDEGRASDVGEEPNGTYISVYDRNGALYTIGRERKILHLVGPDGETVALSRHLDAIIEALDSTLQRYN